MISTTIGMEIEI